LLQRRQDAEGRGRREVVLAVAGQRAGRAVAAGVVLVDDDDDDVADAAGAVVLEQAAVALGVDARALRLAVRGVDAGRVVALLRLVRRDVRDARGQEQDREKSHRAPRVTTKVVASIMRPWTCFAPPVRRANAGSPGRAGRSSVPLAVTWAPGPI